MQKFSKLFLIFCSLVSHEAHAENWFYSVSHTLNNMSIHLVGLASLISMGRYIYDKNKIKNAVDAPETVVRFCQEKLTAHGLNQDQIKIKIIDTDAPVGAFGEHYIIFPSGAADQFKRALENQADEQSIRIIKVYSTFLDHEIGHLKNNDGLKRAVVMSVAYFLSYVATYYTINSSRFSSWFEKPTNFKEFCTTNLSYSLVYLIGTFLTTSTYVRYAQCQENGADAYAIACANDPDALRCAADCLEQFEECMIDVLCGAELNPNLNIVKKTCFEFVRKMLVAQYDSEKPQEDFRTWAKKQTATLVYLKSVLDPEHPSGFSRAHVMRAAADALEAEQAVA